MTPALQQRLEHVLGAAHLQRTEDGRLLAVPPTTEALAALLAFASEEGIRVAVAGAESWQSPDARGDLIISTRGLDATGAVQAEDLYLTCGSGALLRSLSRSAREHGTLLPLDAPRGAARTIGSVLATATAGPLQHGFGPVRDQVLGLTVVTGDGRVIRTGGITVKNVAGFDLMKLHIGGFGGFGIIAECTLRLRATAPADRTFVVQGDADRLTAAGRQIGDLGIEAAAVELISPDSMNPSHATLAVRLLGAGSVIDAQRERLEHTVRGEWLERSGGDWWEAADRALLDDARRPVTIRLGTLPAGLDETLDLLREQLPGGALSAGVLTGMVRWSGRCETAALETLRATLASREIPLTLERAPWEIRRRVGHFGAYREGVGGIVGRLREVADPRHILQATLDPDPSA